MAAENEEIQAYQSYQIQSFDGQEGKEAGPSHLRGVDFETSPLVGLPGGEGGPGFEEPAVLRDETQTDFASIKFQRENTLLTNAERYAESIRGEAELYVRQLRSEVQALNQQADARYEEARLVKEAAEQEAEEKISQAVQRVEEIQQEAYNEGFETGKQEGLKKRYQEAAPYLVNIQKILEEISHFRKQVNYFMENDGVKLSVLMAKKILLQELKTNRNAIWKLLAATLSKMEGKGNFRIWVSPEDFQFSTAARPALAKYMDADQTVTFRAKPELSQGSALIETDRDVIDLTMATQFHHLENLLDRTLGEREAVLTSRPPVKARPSSPETQGAPARPSATETSREDENQTASSTELPGQEEDADADAETMAEPQQYQEEFPPPSQEG